MTRYLKKVCMVACGMMFIPMFALAPVKAETTLLPTTTPSVETDGVVIPTGTTFKTAIPDDNFRKYINETLFAGLTKDEDKFTENMLETMQNCTGKLDVSGKSIVNLTGIQYFTAITELDVSYNNLQQLDISKLNTLTVLNAAYNDLTQITFATDNKLIDIDCSNNNLTLLNLAGITSVEKLDCSDNKLMLLNVAGLYKMTELDCSNNVLPSLAVDGLVALEKLYCDGNGIASLDVSSLRNLKVLECRKSVLNLKVQAVGTDCGVVLPTGAIAPTNISNGGAYNSTQRGIVWDKITGVPASFTYVYAIPGTVRNVTVTVNVDKSDFVEKAVTLGKVDTLTVASTGYNKVKLTWSGVDGATGYRVYRSTSKTSGFTKVKSLTSNSKVTYTNSGLACGTTYYYRVRAYRLIDGNYYFGEYSSVIEGKPVPAKPTSVTVSKYSRTKVKLTWDKVSGASGYRIYRSTSKTSGFANIKTVTSGSKLTYTKKTTRNTKYYYKIRAYKTVNGKKIWSDYSAVKAKTLK